MKEFWKRSISGEVSGEVTSSVALTFYGPPFMVRLQILVLISGFQSPATVLSCDARYFLVGQAVIETYVRVPFLAMYLHFLAVYPTLMGPKLPNRSQAYSEQATTPLTSRPRPFLHPQWFCSHFDFLRSQLMVQPRIPDRFLSENVADERGKVNRTDRFAPTEKKARSDRWRISSNALNFTNACSSISTTVRTSTQS